MIIDIKEIGAMARIIANLSLDLEVAAQTISLQQKAIRELEAKREQSMDMEKE